MTGGGHALLDSGVDRPATLARVRHAAGEVGQVRRGGQGGGGEVDQPRADHRAAPPHLGDVRHVDLVLVVLRVAQRRRLGVDLPLAPPGVGMVDDRQPLGDRAHHSVLDAVVDHLHEVARAAGPAVQVAVLGGAPRLAAGRGLGRSGAGRDRLEDRVQPSDRLVLAADHEAVAALQAPDPAAGPAVDVVDALRPQLLGAADVVAVVRVATVDHGVAGLEQVGQPVDGLLDVAGGHHHPGGARRLELGDEVLEAVGARGALPGQLGHGAGVDVVDHAFVTVGQ